jgi:hypothetical protein
VGTLKRPKAATIVEFLFSVKKSVNLISASAAVILLL